MPTLVRASEDLASTNILLAKISSFFCRNELKISGVSSKEIIYYLFAKWLRYWREKYLLSVLQHVDQFTQCPMYILMKFLLSWRRVNENNPNFWDSNAHSICMVYVPISKSGSSIAQTFSLEKLEYHFFFVICYRCPLRLSPQTIFPWTLELIIIV